MTEPTVPILLAPDAPAVGVAEAVKRALQDLPTGHTGGAQVSFTHIGATAKVFVRVKDFETGAFVDRTWDGSITAAGYVQWKW